MADYYTVSMSLCSFWCGYCSSVIMNDEHVCMCLLNYVYVAQQHLVSGCILVYAWSHTNGDLLLKKLLAAFDVQNSRLRDIYMYICLIVESWASEMFQCAVFLCFRCSGGLCSIIARLRSGTVQMIYQFPQWMEISQTVLMLPSTEVMWRIN